MNTTIKGPFSSANIDLLASQLYAVYCNAVGGKAFNGDALPSWPEFRADPNKTKQADGWIAVAEEALSQSLIGIPATMKPTIADPLV